MSANPWVVLGVGLVGSIGSMIGVMYTPPENTVLKHGFWLAFNACQAATLSPLFFLSPAILSRAALYTCGVVGSLSYVGATARCVFCFKILCLAFSIQLQERQVPLLGRPFARWCHSGRVKFSRTSCAPSWSPRLGNHGSYFSLRWLGGLQWIRTFRVSLPSKCFNFEVLNFGFAAPRRFCTMHDWQSVASSVLTL